MRALLLCLLAFTVGENSRASGPIEACTGFFRRMGEVYVAWVAPRPKPSRRVTTLNLEPLEDRAVPVTHASVPAPPPVPALVNGMSPVILVEHELGKREVPRGGCDVGAGKFAQRRGAPGGRRHLRGVLAAGLCATQAAVRRGNGSSEVAPA